MKIKRLKLALVLCLLSLDMLFSSCGLIAPKPFYNSKASPPQEGTLLYKNGQHVAGTIAFYVHQASNKSEFLQARLVIDSTDTITGKYPLSLNTALWPQTEHNIRYFVWMIDSTSGLQRLESTPTQVFDLNLVFDQTPPQPPGNLSITNQNGHAKLTWTPTNLVNFDSYVINRNGLVIATIRDQGTTSFLNSAYTMADFDAERYKVGASNNADTAYSQKDSLVYGQRLSLGTAYASCSTASDVVSVLESNSSTKYVVAVNTLTGTAVDSGFVGQETGNLMARSLDGTRIFVLSDAYNSTNPAHPYPSQWMTVYSSDNTWLYQNYVGDGFNYPGSWAIGGDDKIYFSNDVGTLSVFDKHGQFLWSSLLLNGSGRYLSISPDSSTLLAVDNEGIKQFSLTGDSADFAARSANIDTIGQFLADWQDGLVFITREKTTLEAWGARTLTVSEHFLPPDSVTDITALGVNEKYLYAACTVIRNGMPATLLVEFDKTTAEQTRTWTFPTIVKLLAGSWDGRYLVACTSSDEWLVDLGGGL